MTANTLMLAYASRSGGPGAGLQAALANHELGYQVGLVFFGASLVCLAPLMRRSALFPAPLAVLTIAAGAAYLADGLLAPVEGTGARWIAPATTALAVLAEFSLCGWMLSAPLRRGSPAPGGMSRPPPIVQSD